MDDTISRQAAINALGEAHFKNWGNAAMVIKYLPSAQPERLTDDDFETIRIHLSAFKEKLCNQHRWKEAEEYQRIIDRFMSFASAQRKGKWIATQKWGGRNYSCSCCKFSFMVDTCMLEPMWNFCPNCGAEMVKGEEDEVN